MRERDDTHECPAPGCTARVPRRHLACRRHWGQVSDANQAWVYRAYRSGDIADHVAAMQAAIAEMQP